MPTQHQAEAKPLTLLCLASFEKGQRFLTEAKRQGCRVFLLTSESLRGKADWPAEDIEEIFYMPDSENDWGMQDTLYGVAHLCRTVEIDRIVPLDDFDLEKAAYLREHLRIPGLGETATRFFRDKLAMRLRASEYGLPVPPFTPTINYEQITRYVDSVAPPWVLKPRLMAGAIGIRKYTHRQEVWDRIHSLGDQQSFFVLEQFIPGDIFHVDSLWFGGEMRWAIASAYGTPPLEVTHSGGIFTTQFVQRDSDLDRQLKSLNERILRAFNLENGASHTEFIRSHADGTLYFLETSARVGGAHISDLIEAGTGVNLFAEWAKIEAAAARQQTYNLPETRQDYAGLLVSLARQEHPDTSAFSDPEIVWRLCKPFHVGLIFQSPSQERINHLLSSYKTLVLADFHASAPPRDKPRD